MQLKHLVINGFKSFADKTEIEFVHGLTGIVGPNGSGKSNITEAIRWTLGEQSAKSLRGEKMGDVIFAGTATRPALNRAEVVMTFDNGDGYLKDQPAEVAITRRLYRDGESDFLINKQAVRLKDIVDLFMDSGLGKESFSFISQGRVEAIFNSKPEERRGILEEAAGVLKYKQQKAKADRELQDTEDNLARVNDIVGELDRQRTPLAEQASIAKDYERQYADYQTTDKAILALEIENLSTEQETTKAEAAVTQKNVAAFTEQTKQLEQQAEQLTATDNQLEGELNAVNDQLLSQSTRLETLTGEANLSNERVNNAQQTLADLEAQLTAAKDEATAAATRAGELEQTLATQVAEQKRLKRELQTAETTTLTPAALNAQLETAQNHYIALLQQQATVNNDLGAAKKDQQVAENQSAAQRERRHELKRRLDRQQQDRDAIAEQWQAAQKQAQEAQAAADKASAAAQTAQAELSAAQTAYQDGVAQYRSGKARYDTLQELTTDYAGFYAGVRAVLKHKATLQGVIGAVAELLVVPAAYQQAIDIALGGSLQSVVTTDQQAAQRAIGYLKDQRAGRATFLPVNVVTPRALPQATRQQLSGQAGFIGVASDLVDYPDHVASVMENLLGSLIVADTLAHGVALANLTKRRFRIVTLEGDLLNPGGAMTGGQVKKQGSSPLARTQEVRDLATELKAQAQQLQTQKQGLIKLKEAADTASADANAARATLSQQEAEGKTLASQVALQDTNLEELTRQHEALRLATSAAADFETTIADLQQQAATLQQDLALAQEESDRLKTALSSASAQAEAQQAATAKLQAALAVATNAQGTTQAQLTQWQDAKLQATQTATRLAERIETITQGAAVSAQEKKDRKATIARLTEEVSTLRTKQETLSAKKAKNRETLSKVSATITTTYAQQHAAMAEAEQQAVALNRLKMNLDTRLSALAENYQLTYEAARAAVTHTAQDLPMLKSQKKLLKRGLDELGPVNPNAIAEYAEIQDRFDFLTRQQADLLDAKQQLQTTMAELDEEVKARFKEMFDLTNAAFTEIFPKMFGGGHAELSLTDPGDLLNTGLEISAQPPGKKLTRLSLLSGGERALTAIVLLFAILQVRPVPFSILDEVEASLDDVNVNRFGEFLKHYASATQFIVITHRRGTMLAANMLYGVTMQESGVSRMMAVNLDELVEAPKA